VSDYYLVVCKEHDEYVDLEKWNPATIPINQYRRLMQHRLRCFHSKHPGCKLVTYALSGYSSDGSAFPGVDKLSETCQFTRINLGEYAFSRRHDQKGIAAKVTEAAKALLQAFEKITRKQPVVYEDTDSQFRRQDK